MSNIFSIKKGLGNFQDPLEYEIVFFSVSGGSYDSHQNFRRKKLDVIPLFLRQLHFQSPVGLKQPSFSLEMHCIRL